MNLHKAKPSFAVLKLYFKAAIILVKHFKLNQYDLFLNANIV